MTTRSVQRTRFKLALFASLVISFMGISSVYLGMEGVAISAITILGGLVSYYSKKETERPSETINTTKPTNHKDEIESQSY